MVCGSVNQHGIFIKQLVEPGSGVFVRASVVPSVCPLTCTKCTLWLQLQIQGNKPEWKGLHASVPAKAVSTQPVCESQTLCNSLPLSGERMYLSNHLNYYNHCRDGNAWISALTLWNFQGPESTLRWVLVSLQNRIMLCEMSLSKLMGLNQNLQIEVGPISQTLADCNTNTQAKVCWEYIHTVHTVHLYTVCPNSWQLYLHDIVPMNHRSNSKSFTALKKNIRTTIKTWIKAIKTK